MIALATAAPPAAAPPSSREIATDVSKATVSIRAAAPGGAVSAGSGFITDPSGTVVTNYHVVKGAERIEIRVASGETYDVTGIRAVDRKRDIAILQIPGFKLPTVRLGDSDAVGPGEHILVVGNALGVLENSVTTGVVSGMRDVDGSKLIQMDAAVSPGNSGGPVVNDNGEVVAITVARLTVGEHLNFAIPVNFVRGYLSQPTQQGLALLRETTDEKSLFAKSPGGFPKQWRSLTSDTLRTITISDDAMLVEIILPNELKPYRKDWSELKKTNDKWIGTWHSNSTCTYKQAFKIVPTQNSCQIGGHVEISSMTSTKIEGVADGWAPGSKFNCEKCAFDIPAKEHPFTWIPADE